MPWTALQAIQDHVKTERQHLRPVDIYKFADSLAGEFGGHTRDDLVRLISETVIRTRGDAMWHQDA